MVTDLQVRRLFDMRNKHDHLYQAADAAGMSSKTAHKYLKNCTLPSQCRVEHTWQPQTGPETTGPCLPSDHGEHVRRHLL